MQKLFSLFILLAGLIHALVQPAMAAEEADLLRITSPLQLARFHSFPIPIEIEFEKNAKPDTFQATLNGKDITASFTHTEHGVHTLVTPRDGLRIVLNSVETTGVNVLKTKIEGKDAKQRSILETFFIVTADQVFSVDNKGAVLQSLDGRLSVKIPPDALLTETTIALTKKEGPGKVEAIYQFAPQNLPLQKPATILLEYDPTATEQGIPDDDIILLSGDHFANRIDPISVDSQTHTIRGMTDKLSSFYWSYYVKLHKRISDIPYTKNFRLPIGDLADPYYSCGLEYKKPQETDLG